MSFHDPCGIRSLRPDALRMQCPALFHEPVHYLAEYSFDYHLFSGAVIAGHERADQPFGCHSAETVAAVDNHRPDTHACSSKRGAHPCRTSAGDKQFGAVVHRNR